METASCTGQPFAYFFPLKRAGWPVKKHAFHRPTLVYSNKSKRLASEMSWLMLSFQPANLFSSIYEEKVGRSKNCLGPKPYTISINRKPETLNPRVSVPTSFSPKSPGPRAASGGTLRDTAAHASRALTCGWAVEAPKSSNLETLKPSNTKPAWVVDRAYGQENLRCKAKCLSLCLSAWLWFGW